MSTTHDQILSMLKGCSGQKPMDFSALLEASGLQTETLDMVLDQMYHARKINQATVTKNGITQREVWPTGVIVTQAYGVVNGLKVAPTPPRRDEATIKKEPARSLRILQFIEKNPRCKSAEIKAAVNLEGFNGYIKSHLKRGAVVVARNANGLTYQLAAGMTAQMIYDGGRSHNGNRKTKPVVKVAEEIYKIPNFSAINPIPFIAEILPELKTKASPIEALRDMLPDNAFILLTPNGGLFVCPTPSQMCKVLNVLGEAV